MGFATNAIHVGQEPDPATGAIVAPIYQTSTYVNEELGKNKNGYDYARTNHPNRKASGAHHRQTRRGPQRLCVFFGDGGDRCGVSLAAARRSCGAFRSGVRRGFPAVHATAGSLWIGIQFCGHFVARMRCCSAFRPNTKMLYLETPTNPTMRMADIAALSKVASQRNITVVVDNTFLSPYLQRPIELGAHIVVHSMTKYLNGHSDSTGGAVVLTRPEDAEKIYFIQRSAGSGLAPMDCFLISRGIKTLAVRMLQHNANGLAVARHLDAHPKFARCFTPGCLAIRSMKLRDGNRRVREAMLSFDLGSLEAARQLSEQVKLCALAESLGGVETLISLPA